MIIDKAARFVAGVLLYGSITLIMSLLTGDGVNWYFIISFSVIISFSDMFIFSPLRKKLSGKKPDKQI